VRAHSGRVAIVVTLLAVAAAAIVIFSVWVLVFSPRSPTTVNEGCAYCGTGMALGKPTEDANAANHWYNFTVESAGGGIPLDGLGFNVTSPTGTPIPPSADWSLVVRSSSGALEGVYSFADSGWTNGGGTVLASSQIVVFDTGTTDLDGEGNVLNVVGVGSYQGSISVNIP
jgi:hypothetical protein